MVNDRDEQETASPPGHSRREFVRKLVLGTAYAAPAILSFTAGGAFAAKSPSGMMMKMMSPPGMGMMPGDPGDIWKKTPPKDKPKEK